MEKSRFTKSQNVAVLNEGEAGLPVAQVARKHGISAATYYGWKPKCGGAGGGCRGPAMGFLEMSRPAAVIGLWLEPQTRLAGVMPVTIEPAAPDEAKGAHTRETIVVRQTTV